MNILVCMKQVPDTQKVRIDPARNTLIRKGVPSITNPLDESALELALEIKASAGGKITVLTMGIPDSEEILRDGLSMGADHAYLLSHSDFSGADTLATSYTLGMGIEKIGSFDLLLFGKQAIDGDTAQVGPEVAGLLGIPVIAFVTGVLAVEGGSIVVERMTDNGKEIVECEYPVVFTVVKAAQRLRIPTLDGMMRSFDIPVTRYGAREIGADPGRCGLKGSPTRVKKVFSPKHLSKVKLIEGSIEEKAKEFVRIISKHK
ncbi:MAG TPA: electron transfer flavoprotein subunit beta/FixA family protein [Spirochaetes bacterium]|nr:electron transfer flavoprotein subunit beta/FixA family protein [Spirochaetota bacterium]